MRMERKIKEKSLRIGLREVSLRQTHLVREGDEGRYSQRDSGEEPRDFYRNLNLFRLIEDKNSNFNVKQKEKEMNFEYQVIRVNQKLKTLNS